MSVTIQHIQSGQDTAYDGDPRCDDLQVYAVDEGEPTAAAMRCGSRVIIPLSVDGDKLDEKRRQAIEDSGGRVSAALLDESGIREALDDWADSGAPISDAPS